MGDGHEDTGEARDPSPTITHVFLEDIIIHTCLLTTTTAIPDTINVSTRSGKTSYPAPPVAPAPSVPPTPPATPPPTPPPSPPPLPQPEPITPAAATQHYHFNWPSNVSKSDREKFVSKLVPLTDNFYKRRNPKKKIYDDADKIWHKFVQATGVNHTSNIKPIVTPDSAMDVATTIDMDLYQNICYRYLDIGKTTRILSLVYYIWHKWRKSPFEPHEMVTAALAAIIRADQKYHPVTKIPSDCTIHHGIIFYNRKVASSGLFSTNTPWIIKPNSPVGIMILRWAHIEKNCLKFGHDNHHGHSGTLSKVNTGGYSCYIPDISKVCKIFIQDCAWCNRSQLKKYRVEKGATYTKVSTDPQFFRTVSMDPLGVLLVSPYRGSKKKIKVYPVIFKCVSTGCVYLTMTESIDQAGIINAIRRLAFTVGVMPDTVTNDAQPSFTNKMLNPTLEDGHLFGNTHFVKHLSKSQHRNYCESSVWMGKRIWKRMLKISDADPVSKISSLTILEMVLLMDIISFSINIIPYSYRSNISPAHWRYAGSKLNLILPDITDSSTGNASFVQSEALLLKYQKIIHEERKIALYENESRYKKHMLTSGNKFSDVNIKANIGDVVILEDNKLGIIEKFLSKHEGDEATASIKTQKGIIKRAVLSLHPLLHLRAKAATT